jgi:gamma-tubulin complex component 3
MVHELSASHGDPFVAAFAERILGCVTTPFYDMLQHWIYDGELVDPFHEFFVIELEPVITEQRETDRRHAPATSGWEDKYKLDDKMIPTIMSSVLVRKVFLIGKSLNFLRYNCLDSAWVEAYCKDATRELHYGDTATLQASIDKAYRATMAQVTHLMDKKFHLFEHLRALKRYILLGEGDFIALLMDSVAPNLDRPAGSQYRHTLTAQLEHAIRGSNAQYENPDILRRLDVRVLELNTGDIGWDVFALEYRVDAPVNVVITPWANRKYLTMFNFLWRVKRVEFALRSTWRRIMTGARGVLANVDDGTDRDWKAARCCMAEMIHLVNQLQYYILFEVIEASWDQLQAAITKPNCTLDDLIGAHAKYLESITRKGLLGPARHALTGGREESFPSQLHYLLKNMLAYRDVVDGLYSFSVSNFTNRQERSVVDDARDPTRGNARGFNPRDESLRSPSPFTAKRTYLLTKERTDSPFPANEVLPGVPLGEDKDQMLTALRVRLAELSTEFRTRVTTFLRDLAVQPDVNMKFLGVVMNFNGVYGPRKKVEQVPPPGEEDEESDDEIEGVIDFVKGHGGGAGGGIDGRSEVAVGTVRAGGEGDGGGNDDGADADVDDVSSRPASKEKGKRKEKEKEELSSKEDEIPALQRRRTRHVRDRDRDKERDKVVDVK